MSRSICVITGTRADYGLLRPLMHEMSNDAEMRLQLIVTGMHLSPEFGLTWREIERDGFPITERIEILLSSDSDVAVCKAMGLGLCAFGEALKRLAPDLVIGLGDRFELLAAVTAAAVCRISVAHIHGGELTEGAFDDAFRHAITKMSHLHFTATEVYRQRVIQLGEDPQRVFNVGALGVDNIRTLVPWTRDRLVRELDLPASPRMVAVTFHPVTLEESAARGQFRVLLEALDALEETTLVFTYANADPEGRVINGMIDEFVTLRRDRARAFASLGQLRYLSLLRCVDAVVGNSSSGIIEAPGLGVPTVDIGDRQRGRVRADSVVHCEPTPDGVAAALRKALSAEFAAFARTAVNPYGDGHAAERIHAVLREQAHTDLKKRFHDVPLPTVSRC